MDDAGDAFIVGGTNTNAASKTIFFNNNSTSGALVWGPSANRTISLPDATGVVQLTSQGIQAVSAGAAQVTSGQLILSNSNGVSFGVNGQTITASIATSLTGINVSAGTTSNNLTAFTLSNSNGLAFGINGSVITGSYTVPTGGGVAISGGTQLATSGTIVFSNSNGISFGLSNSSIMTASYTVPAAQTIQTQNIAVPSAGTQTATSGTVIFSNSNGISFGMSNSSVITASYTVPPAQTVQTSNIVVPSAGTQTATSGTVIFSNSNGISFGMSNSSIITASYTVPSVPAQTVQTMGMFVTGNSTQNSSTTLDARSMSFNAIGGVSIGYSNSSIQVSAPATSNVAGVGGIVVSTNGSTISISGPTITDFEIIPLLASGSVSYSQTSNAQWLFEPFYLDANLSGGRINRLMIFGNTSQILNPNLNGATSFVSNVTSSRGMSLSYANTVAIYSRGAGSNSTRLESVWSNTWTFGITHSVSVKSTGATSVNATNAATMNYIASIDSNGSYTTSSVAGSTTVTTNTSSMNTSAMTVGISSILNMLSSQFIMPVGFNTTIVPGNYWFAHAMNSTTATAGSGASSVFTTGFTIGIAAALSQSFRIWGQTAANTNSSPFPGAGAFNTTSNTPPATVAFTQIGNFTQARQYFNWVNSTI